MMMTTELIISLLILVLVLLVLLVLCWILRRSRSRKFTVLRISTGQNARVLTIRTESEQAQQMLDHLLDRVILLVESGEEPEEEHVAEPGEELKEECVAEPGDEPEEKREQERVAEPGEELKEERVAEPGEEPEEERAAEPGEEPEEERAAEPGEELWEERGSDFGSNPEASTEASLPSGAMNSLPSKLWTWMTAVVPPATENKNSRRHSSSSST